MQIIFDFDGVIINSHKIKTKAFYEIFKSYGKKIATKARKFHLNNIGKSRYFKFKFILKNILNKKITKKELLRLDQNFDAFVEKKIRKMVPSKNLLKFLKLQKKFHDLYISTGTPQNKIIDILKEKKLFSFFKKIYGSPQSKIDHIKKIRKKNTQILFIGDSFEDYMVSQKANINFVLKLNSENFFFRRKIKVKKINSFKYLGKYLKFITQIKL
jgi:phosphoglycolate phosphatase-like HAD superfamily hydrolase